MQEEHPGRKHIDSRLRALIDESEKLESLNLRMLKTGDVVSVRTKNTVYTLKMIKPDSDNAEILVNSDGRHVTQETKGRVFGTTLTGTGSMIKLNTIILGLRLSVFVEGIGELILSPTQEVRVNGVIILPFGDQFAT